MSENQWLGRLAAPAQNTTGSGMDTVDFSDAQWRVLRDAADILNVAPARLPHALQQIAFPRWALPGSHASSTIGSAPDDCSTVFDSDAGCDANRTQLSPFYANSIHSDYDGRQFSSSPPACPEDAGLGQQTSPSQLFAPVSTSARPVCAQRPAMPHFDQTGMFSKAACMAWFRSPIHDNQTSRNELQQQFESRAPVVGNMRQAELSPIQLSSAGLSAANQQTQQKRPCSALSGYTPDTEQARKRRIMNDQGPQQEQQGSTALQHATRPYQPPYQARREVGTSPSKSIRRGPFQPQHRIQTHFTRMIGACVRCHLQRVRVCSPL